MNNWFGGSSCCSGYVTYRCCITLAEAGVLNVNTKLLNGIDSVAYPFLLTRIGEHRVGFTVVLFAVKVNVP